MRLKSYFAASVDAAMQQARLELGDDAMLLDARATTGEAKRFGGHEVIFALPDSSSPNAKGDSVQQPGGGATGAFAKQSHDPKHNLDALRREIDSIRDAVARVNPNTAPDVVPPVFEQQRYYDRLVAADVAPDVASRILSNCEAVDRSTPGTFTKKPFDARLREQLGKLVRARPEFDSDAQKGTSAQKLVAFVGPPGSGKTTALVKVAVSCGLASRKPILIVSLDNYRVACHEQLRTYACILGVSFQHAETVHALQTVLEEHRHKHWIFLDTPGLGPKETDVIQELSQFNKLSVQIETHLVLSAAMRSADVRLAVKRFAPFHAGKLLFTHLDETEHFGGLISAAAWSGKPVSYLSFGQRIPEDLEAANSERLVSLIHPQVEPGMTRSGEIVNQAGVAAVGL